jgi:hypothetical protein
MKKFLLPLLVVFALPTAVSAESVWLILSMSYIAAPSKTGVAMEKIKVKDMDQCEDQGAKWVSSKRVTAVMTYKLSRQKDDFYRGFECIEGE